MAGDQHMVLPIGRLPGNYRNIASLRIGVPSGDCDYSIELAGQTASWLPISPHPSGLHGALPWSPHGSGRLGHQSSKLRRAMDPTHRRLSSDFDSRQHLASWASPLSKKQGALPANTLRQLPSSLGGISFYYSSDVRSAPSLETELALSRALLLGISTEGQTCVVLSA